MSPAEDPIATTSPAATSTLLTPPAIRVEDLYKSFRIPTHRVDSLKERAVHPFAAREYRELRALDGISFDVHQGEFFGIVGRNGSGKSTLLKLLASIYRSDSGRIQMAGRLAPFIELGVGFNVELTARENVVLNGVMMGLTPQETRDRLDAVIAFAELEEFVDLKLKNYSSGMLVRLAFSQMLEVDADILLIDEVLAVGDAAFQQKCADAFREMKAAGKTIVLVTHEMATVEEYCHRAMLISEGQIEHIGDPAEVGRRYLQLNFERDVAGDTEHGRDESAEVRLIDARVENAAGEPVAAIEQGEPIRLRIELEAKQDSDGLHIGMIVINADGVGVAELAAGIGNETRDRPVRAGQRMLIESTLDNPFVTGHYYVNFGINRSFEGGIALYVPNAMNFVVYGGPKDRGIVVLKHETETAIVDGSGE
jgi:ABC-2 type transport system ATP-binding protein